MGHGLLSLQLEFVYVHEDIDVGKRVVGCQRQRLDLRCHCHDPIWGCSKQIGGPAHRHLLASLTADLVSTALLCPLPLILLCRSLSAPFLNIERVSFLEGYNNNCNNSIVIDLRTF